MKEGLSALPSFLLSKRFLGIVSKFFSEFLHGARKLYEVLHDSQIFWEKSFAQKFGEMCQNRVFFILLEDLVINL